MAPRPAHAAQLVWDTAETVSLTSPAVIFTIPRGSVADALHVNATSVAVTLSNITGGTFTLTSPQALSSSTTGSGGSLSQACSSGIETDTITQASGSETYTLTPTGSACVTPSQGNGGGSGGGGGGSSGSASTGGGGGSAYNLSIDSGAPTTATTSVTLSLYGTGAYTMELSNASTFAGAAWIPYATTLPWILASNQGTETVYAQFRGISGTLVGSAQASIDLVSGTPSASAPSSSLSLLDQLHALQAQLAALLAQAGQSAASTTPSHFVFTRNLYLGMTGNDVKQLQAFLAKNPALYPEGKVTGYFGTLTLKAVQRFQVKYGLAKAGARAYGYVGPATRAKLNGLVAQGLTP